MSGQRSVIAFEALNGLDKMIEQRAAQEGITVSEYVREAVFLELWFSGDLEAMKFVAKRVAKRTKEILLDKVSRVDLKERVEALGVL